MSWASAEVMGNECGSGRADGIDEKTDSGRDAWRVNTGQEAETGEPSWGRFTACVGLEWEGQELGSSL